MQTKLYKATLAFFKTHIHTKSIKQLLKKTTWYYSTTQFYFGAYVMYVMHKKLSRSIMNIFRSITPLPAAKSFYINVHARLTCDMHTTISNNTKMSDISNNYCITKATYNMPLSALMTYILVPKLWLKLQQNATMQTNGPSSIPLQSVIYIYIEIMVRQLTTTKPCAQY